MDSSTSSVVRLFSALAWVGYGLTSEIYWSCHGVNESFFLYDFNSTEATGFPTSVHTFRLQSRLVNVTLVPELFNWLQIPYESIFVAKAQEYLRSSPLYTLDESSSPM